MGPTPAPAKFPPKPPEFALPVARTVWGLLPDGADRCRWLRPIARRARSRRNRATAGVLRLRHTVVDMRCRRSTLLSGCNVSHSPRCLGRGRKLNRGGGRGGYTEGDDGRGWGYPACHALSLVILLGTPIESGYKRRLTCSQATRIPGLFRNRVHFPYEIVYPETNQAARTLGTSPRRRRVPEYGVGMRVVAAGGGTARS